MFRDLSFLLILLATACRSPLAHLEPGPGGAEIQLATVTAEDHSRQLKYLRPLAPSEINTPQARRKALEDHAHWLGWAFKEEAQECGVCIRPGVPYRLELVVTDLGEIRTKYIVYGIASGVAWGVGTGLLAHNTKLALGLGGYELLEETAFWVGGSALFSSYSAPAVVEARLFHQADPKPLWSETYYALSGRAWTRKLPGELQRDRRIQLHGALQKIILKILDDLKDIPYFPADLKTGPARREFQKKVLDRLVSEAPPEDPVPAILSTRSEMPAGACPPSSPLPVASPSPSQLRMP